MTHPPRPPDLPPDQHPIWDDTTRRLTTAGITADPNHIRAYVAAVHQHRQATRLLDQTGPLIERHGQAIQNPALTTAQRAEQRIARLARTLGLTTLTSAPPPGTVKDAGELKEPPAGELGRWCEEHKRWECRGRKHGGSPCHKPRLIGLPNCNIHAGQDGKVKHLAAVAARARGPLPVGGIPRQVHPAEALLEEVWYWTGYCEWVDQIVAGLQQGDVVWGMTQRRDVRGGDFPGVTIVEEATLNTWVALAERAHRHRREVAKLAMDAEVDLALLRLRQAEAAQAYRAYQEGLELLGLSEEQWARARAGYPAVLRRLATSA